MKRNNSTVKLLCVYFILILVSLKSYSQETSDIKTIPIHKLNKDFPVKYSWNSPIDAFVTINYINTKGKKGLLRPYSTYRFHPYFPDENTPDSESSEELINDILDREAKECIIYKDSVAAVISTYKDSLYAIRYLSCEDGKWLNAGEDLGEGLVETREKAISNFANLASYIPMIERMKQTPKDTLNFINYIKEHGKKPSKYVLEKLSKHKVVVYGEMHRRKVSWDVLNEVIQSPEFVKTIGTVFFELPSHKQKDLDLFYSKKDLDTDILLEVFGAEQINGWHDKDEFDFMIALKRLNDKLPEDQKIKVILTDYQIQWDSIRTTEEFKNFPKKDRNTHMADVIEQNLKKSSDTRNSLFIVGFMHAHKKNLPGMFSAPQGQEPALTAAAQLVKQFPDEDIFCIFPHCATISNSGIVGGKIRNGLYDYIFELNNNIPVAFDLADSPFGREPFDGALELKFNSAIGNYEDNYDGYIFFRKLEDEEKGNPLYELFTDDYVEEIKRRAKVIGRKEEEKWFYGVLLKDLTKEIIIQSMEEHAQGKRWNFDD
ncbi:MAG: hypothetical protein LIO93_10465 [Bacteroidales bacterium]|nr:hypothetical protein [Bacteroidales bacterium]